MITIIDIIRAYSGMVEELFGKPPTTKDLIEVKDRPCTYIQGDVQTELEAGLQHDTFSMTLVYYAPFADRGYKDMLNAQHRLSAALIAPVEVDDEFHMLPDSVNIDVIREEMILVCTFEVECWQDTDAIPVEGSTDPMLQLDINGKRAAEPED